MNRARAGRLYPPAKIAEPGRVQVEWFINRLSLVRDQSEAYEAQLRATRKELRKLEDRLDAEHQEYLTLNYELDTLLHWGQVVKRRKR